MLYSTIITPRFRAEAHDVLAATTPQGDSVILQCITTMPTAGQPKLTTFCYIPLSGDQNRDQHRVENFISMLTESTERSLAKHTCPAQRREPWPS